jgi:hypothetical protein
MAKVSAPLLSFSAAGQIAKTQVYSTWRGVPYVRRHVVPNNPNTSEQQATRNVFSTLNQTWKLSVADAIAPWNAYATGKPLTGRNAYMGQNIAAMRPDSDWAHYIGSPGSGGGLAPAAFAPSGGSGTIACALTAPALPDGWSIVKAVAVARKNDNPHTTTSFATYCASDSSSPYSPALSGLVAGAYEVAGWFVFLKPDGSTAYGPSITSAATVS